MRACALAFLNEPLREFLAERLWAQSGTDRDSFTTSSFTNLATTRCPQPSAVLSSNEFIQSIEQHL